MRSVIIAVGLSLVLPLVVGLWDETRQAAEWEGKLRSQSALIHELQEKHRRLERESAKLERKRQYDRFEAQVYRTHLECARKILQRECAGGRASRERALRVATLDAEIFLGDLSDYGISDSLESDGWHIDFIYSKGVVVADGSAHYVVDSETCRIISSSFEQ